MPAVGLEPGGELHAALQVRAQLLVLLEQETLLLLVEAAQLNHHILVILNKKPVSKFMGDRL